MPDIGRATASRHMRASLRRDLVRRVEELGLPVSAVIPKVVRTDGWQDCFPADELLAGANKPYASAAGKLGGSR